VLNNKEEKPETVTSMEMNEFHNFNSEAFNNEPLNVIDIPGQGFFKLKIMELLPSAKIFIIFLDSSDK
jgi:signal recognition particle receptor subunit beta